MGWVKTFICISIFCFEADVALASPIYWYTPWTFHHSSVSVSDHLLPVSAPLKTPTFFERLFTNDLMDEFKEKYRQNFGSEEGIGIISYGPTATYYFSHNDYEPQTRQTYDSEKLKSFGEYMSKRLAEYHLDLWLKSNPNTHQVYVVKEKITHVQITVTDNSIFHIRHSWSGNYLEAWIDNPYLDCKTTWDLPFTNSGTPRSTETTLIFSKSFSRRLNANMFIKNLDGTASLVLQRPINKKLTASFTALTYFKPEGITTREKASFVGLVWNL